MAEIGLKERKIKDLMALEVVTEHIQFGNYASTLKRVPEIGDEYVSLIL